ncbi:HTTM domain-containing protein [Bizionia argentinensis JUB59]|uniref:HTTM domain-containing protein n=1 Tax=Bizionia argentinensis JUB59 TaxID=1046627 RepID=G2ECX8_9FLAO|nr:HTTM domain-containing protein [Bizionia argentinensis]EGV43709.1 HTTM domain-containing protein [Bizionia argentinensis JUB59]
MRLTNFLFKQVDNSALIIFRIIFGLLCFLESVGAIFTGWLRRTLVEPEFTFTFIGFEWLQPLPGSGMYIYYLIMGGFGLFIMLGYRYRFSAFMFAIMWTATYLMQKSSYNNHYYLLALLSAIMVILPAHKNASLDAKHNPSIKENGMPNWCRYIFILQMFIVYTYGAIVKLYPDWLDASIMGILMKSKQHYSLVGEFLQNEWLHYFLAYGGILFDGLIIPLLLYKPTRKLAFFAAVFFHLFNSFIFQVGIFPYLSLAFALFFFEPQAIHRIFLKKKPFYSDSQVIIPAYKKPMLTVFAIYFSFQILLPLRHIVIPQSVLWTEEGHRMSWRMMLRSKSGHTIYYVVDKKSQVRTTVNLDHYLTPKQKRLASAKPDAIWQFSQVLKEDYAKKGQDISVYVDSRISVNGRPFIPFIDPNVDLAATKWSHFKHSEWILPPKQGYFTR